MGRYRVRAVFISDVHLGTRACNAAMLLEFLRAVQTDRLYLVGDIIDLERLFDARRARGRPARALAVAAHGAGTWAGRGG